ncbi:sulfatase [Niveispirillum fermenti]|uniref:sulfatase family protein n=1 Tax=Niveispirillum fermenti TaxID=1233113 RepID=UPI003A87809C
MSNLSRRKLLLASAALSLTLAAPFAGRAAVAAEPPARPNIVVFLADDISYNDVSISGDRNVRTPALDRLASQGMTFDRAFVASPTCAPSRAALLTGMMPARNGAEANHDRTSAVVRKLPSFLQEQGYQVVAFGKVAHYQHTGTYGFDYYANDTFHDHKGIAAAAEWLKARKDKRPLALFVGSNWPHVPWPRTTEGYAPDAITLPPKTVDTPETREARARFYAAVTRMDQDLATTMDAVDSILGPETFVLYSADHGTQWPFGKWNLYDTGTRVPMVVRWNGRVQAGTRTNAMVSWVDILPTLVQLAGGRQPEGIDGVSFSSLFGVGSGPAGRPEIYTTHNNDGRINTYPMRSIRTERWKYIQNLLPDTLHTTHIDLKVARTDSGVYFPSWREAAERDPAAKAIVDAYYKRPAEELYDLQADPDEQVNLAADPRHAKQLKELRTRLDRWRKAQGDTGRIPVQPRVERGPMQGEDD